MSNDLTVALIIGLGMGFFLERAGFGSARKLVSQFYLHDMAVFKVMFTAIVTAMVGIYLLSTAGFIRIDELPLIPTFVWPQIVGGLILGAGFIIGGYCPGTSGVAAATGKIDGMVFMAGLLGGMLLYAACYPLVEPFMFSTKLGSVTLYDYFGIPYGLLVLAVVAMAIGGFWGATVVERKCAHLRPLDRGDGSTGDTP
jgi:hypothetical protein